MNKQIFWRQFFLMSFLVLSFVLFDLWRSDHQKQPPDAPKSLYFLGSDLIDHQKTNHIAQIETPLMKAEIDIYGNIISFDLLKYPKIQYQTEPYHLLGHHADDSAMSFFTQDHQVQAVHFRVLDRKTTSSQAQVLTLIAQKNNLLFEKIYTISPDRYPLTLTMRVTNIGKQAISQVGMGHGIFYTASHEHQESGKSYFGASVSTPDQLYQQVSFSSLEKAPMPKKTASSGWIAVQEPYFMMAWIPQSQTTSTYEGFKIKPHTYWFQTTYETTHLVPGQSFERQSILYGGPLLIEDLKTIAPGLDLSIDYGVFWIIAKPIFKMMNALHDGVGNWGVAILLTTLLIRLFLLPLTWSSLRSMAKMKKIQPEIEQLKKEYVNDRQALGSAMMALYKKHKVNPMGGCFPILLQIPVFLSLYWVIIGSVELRHAPFVAWIHDLSAPDPYYILPVLMGVTMFIQQKLSPSTFSDPMQERMMLMMPILMIFFFFSFPSGLVLYWVFSNIISIIQQVVLQKWSAN